MKETKKACKTALYAKRRKATGFRSLGDESGNIKIPADFLNKTYKKKSKTEKVNITIEFYIFLIVKVQNFSLK